MYNNYLNILKLYNTVLRCKIPSPIHLRQYLNTINSYSTVSNYYDIKDKRDASDSLGFEENDLRRTWTNRDDSISNPFININNGVTPMVVETYKICKITNERLRVKLPLNALESYELVSAVTHNILQSTEDFTLKSLANYLEKVNLLILKSEIEANSCLKRLINNLQIQWEKLINSRKITLQHNVMLLLIFDQLSLLTHELRNLIQSQMLLNIHKFTPVEIIYTFQVFSRYKERYKSFLNLLCLIFYDHTIPNIRNTRDNTIIQDNITTRQDNISTKQDNISATHGQVDVSEVIKFLKVLKDFKFKKLTDVLYAQVYDQIESIGVKDLIAVGELFFKHKRDPNFVEFYTKLFSILFKIKQLDFHTFETNVLSTINGNCTVNEPKEAEITVELDDINVLKSMFGCKSEFLISSVHHRIEFKRLWRHNINTRNTPWRVTNSVSSRQETVVNPVLTTVNPVSPTVNPVLTTVNPVLSTVYMSYLTNFEVLYEKIEKVIVTKFKFQKYNFDFISNLIALVSDYSRYSNTNNSFKILSNLYSVISNVKDGNVNLLQVKRIIPTSLRDNSHVFFYKIDPQNFYYRLGNDQLGDCGIRYFKPEITIAALFEGNATLYSLLLNSIQNIMKNQVLMDKDDLMDFTNVVKNVLHPFYCVNSCQVKPFLTIDLLHMGGKLNTRDPNLIEFSKKCVNTVENALKNGLNLRLNRFTEFCKEFITSQLDQFELNLKEKIDILKTFSTLGICDHNLTDDEFFNKFVNLTVDQLLDHMKHATEEDRIKVGVDLKLFDCLCDLIQFPVNDQCYELLTQLVKIIGERIDYYSVPELIKLMNSVSCSIKHFSVLNLEMNETYENLNQNLQILRENALEKFNLKSNLEEDFNVELKILINLLVM